MLEGQVFISDGNKPQNQSNHIIIHQKNLYFVLKAINGLNYNNTKKKKMHSANQSYSCELTNQLNEFWKITPLITNTDQILCLTFHHRLG